jgi:iron complex outermembrane receptor protein
MLHPLRSLLTLLLLLLAGGALHAQTYKVRGTVTDGTTGETIFNAKVQLKGAANATLTDLDGRFELGVPALPPFTLVITTLGYAPQEVEVKSLDQDLKCKLTVEETLLKEANVVGERIRDKQKQAPLTVESMDIIAIKEAPSGNFYESLGNLKGVDMTAASFGFKVINTRGFNSTSPVRSLQLIDGVDNQSPGLNFSLGNFLGASDLDVMKVDIVAGASSAYFGPGAFNGVINMTTKSPWMFPGLSVSAKGGERSMFEGAVRWAQVMKDKDGKDRWAYKLNAFALTAEDWYAENYDATSNSPVGVTNPGRYDGVNIYGDENVTVNNDFSKTMFDRRQYPGLGLYLRPGYREIDLVDYGTQNVKLGGSFHYRLNDGDSVRAPLELIAASNFSTGSTVYQGENRYRLEDVKFFQHRLELRQEGKWFVRGYVTHEDAGRTYDIFTTGLRLQEASGTTTNWNTRYFTLWETWIKPQINVLRPDFITVQEAPGQGINSQEAYDVYIQQYVADNNAFFSGLHQWVVDSINTLDNNELNPAYLVGTDRFNAKLDEITGRRFTEGGSLFYDRSALAHAMGEYRFKPAFGEVVVGGNFRQYLPATAGTIMKDTGDVVIRNSEFGLFAGLEKKLAQDRLKATVTLRMDKNQNFNALFSPAASLVWSETGAHVWRVSFSSAIRNPTLADQYLYYNVGRAILLGNVDGQFEEGRDSLFTVESFNAYRTSPSLLQGLSRLEYFNVDRLRPEQVRTIELGYRGTHWENVYIDAGVYNSWYTDFIGFVIGITGTFDPITGFPNSAIQAYRLAANATGQVTTQGASLGVNWYRRRFTWNANYSYNKLVSGEDDPIIPAFNTPQNKFNVGVTAHDLQVPFTDLPHLGFGVNWKYVEGFTFTGSPQFTGPITSYDMVDAQVNVKFPKAHTTVKVGASNLFGVVPLFDADVPDDERLERMWDNAVYMVYGGPRIGRMAYVQLIYELDKR